MNIHELWEKTLKKTEIIRPRVKPLETRGTTHLPYIFLAESLVNRGDAVVRRGEIMVDEPRLLLPSNLPQLEGFEFDEAWKASQNYLMNFFLIRGIRFPSHKFENKTSQLDVFEGGLAKALPHFRKMLEYQENISTGLIVGPEDCWQLSMLVFAGSQMVKQAEGDILRLLDQFRRGEER